MNVCAVDISHVGIEKIQNRAAEQNLIIDTTVMDITKEPIKGFFDGIVSVFAFHHLKEEDALEVIGDMQEHTHQGGFNLITTFTKDGDFYRNNPETKNFYVEGKDALENLYKEWRVISVFEKEGQARCLDKEGRRQQNVFAGIIAQKK